MLKIAASALLAVIGSASSTAASFTYAAPAERALKTVYDITDVQISIDPKVCTSRPTNEVQLTKWINDYYPRTSKSGIADCNKAYCDQVSEYLSTDECDPN